MGRPRAALVLLSVFLSIGVVNATDKLKLRGVPHSLKPAYAPLAPSPELLGLLPGYISTSTALTKDEELWKCLNGQVIPWAFVNDDYCDCADGSDEPGTSACGHIEKARFHCRNPRHVPANIPSFLVDDGICDPECCDGSSELPATPGSPPPCPNTCRELAERAKQERMEKEKVVKAGWEKRRAWETEYAEKKNGKMAVINELRGKVEEARRRVEVLRGEKDVAEAIRASEQATASPTETAKTPEPEVKLGEPYVENLEEKPAEPAAEKKEEQFFPYPKEYAPPPQGSADKPAEEKPAEAKEEQFFPYPKEYAPPPQDSGDKPAAADQPEEIEHKEEDYNDYPDPSDSPEPSAGVPEELPETKAYNEANEELRKLEDEIKREEEWVNKDFGEAGVWSGVGDGGCFEGGKGEYKYEFCIGGRATQKNGAGGYHIASLGTFVGFEENGRVLKFENGDHCWNGPSRSVTVKVECGAEVEVEGVTEPSKCEYVARVKSPAVCEWKEDKKEGAQQA